MVQASPELDSDDIKNAPQLPQRRTNNGNYALRMESSSINQDEEEEEITGGYLTESALHNMIEEIIFLSNPTTKNNNTTITTYPIIEEEESENCSSVVEVDKEQLEEDYLEEEVNVVDDEKTILFDDSHCNNKNNNIHTGSYDNAIENRTHNDANILQMEQYKETMIIDTNIRQQSRPIPHSIPDDDDDEWTCKKKQQKRKKKDTILSNDAIDTSIVIVEDDDDLTPIHQYHDNEDSNSNISSTKDKSISSNSKDSLFETDLLINEQPKNNRNDDKIIISSLAVKEAAVEDIFIIPTTSTTANTEEFEEEEKKKKKDHHPQEQTNRMFITTIVDSHDKNNKNDNENCNTKKKELFVNDDDEADDEEQQQQKQEEEEEKNGRAQQQEEGNERLFDEALIKAMDTPPIRKTKNRASIASQRRKKMIIPIAGLLIFIGIVLSGGIFSTRHLRGRKKYSSLSSSSSSSSSNKDKDEKEENVITDTTTSSSTSSNNQNNDNNNTTSSPSPAPSSSVLGVEPTIIPDNNICTNAIQIEDVMGTTLIDALPIVIEGNIISNSNKQRNDEDFKLLSLSNDEDVDVATTNIEPFVEEDENDDDDQQKQFSQCNSGSIIRGSSSRTNKGVWYTLKGTGKYLIATTCQPTTANIQLKLYVFVGSSCDDLDCVVARDTNDNIVEEEQDQQQQQQQQQLCNEQNQVAWSSINDETYFIFVQSFSSTHDNTDETSFSTSVEPFSLSIEQEACSIIGKEMILLPQLDNDDNNYDITSLEVFDSTVGQNMVQITSSSTQSSCTNENYNNRNDSPGVWYVLKSQHHYGGKYQISATTTSPCNDSSRTFTPQISVFQQRDDDNGNDVCNIDDLECVSIYTINTTTKEECGGEEDRRHKQKQQQHTTLVTLNTIPEENHFFILVHGIDLFDRGEFVLSIEFQRNVECSNAIGPIKLKHDTNITSSSSMTVLYEDTLLGDEPTTSNGISAWTECGSSVNNGGGGLWYSIIGTGSQIYATTCHPSTSVNTQLSIFTVSCDMLWCVTGSSSSSHVGRSSTGNINRTIDNDNRCGDQGSEVSWFAWDQVVYYLFVHGQKNNSHGKFSLSIQA